LGYIEGKNLVIEHRAAEGNAERLAGLAVELVQRKPDVILAFGGDVAPIAQRATRSVPIVMVTSADPVKGGLVASLGRPNPEHSDPVAGGPRRSRLRRRVPGGGQRAR
jgi:putative ABC transport system substrate-binding protein